MATASATHFELQNALQKPTGDVTDTTSIFFLQSMVETNKSHLSIHHKNPEDPVIHDHIWTSKCDV